MHHAHFSRKFVRHNIRQFNNIDFSSEVSTVHKFVYTDEALLLVRQYNFQPTRISSLVLILVYISNCPMA